MVNISDYLKSAVDKEASDVFIVAGAPISAKVLDIVVRMDDRILMPPDTMEIILEIYNLAGRTADRLFESGDDDFSFSFPGVSRFRVNAYRQRGSYALVIRIIPFEIPDYKTIGIPEEVMNLAEATTGMVLITGVAGSGKSTTEACLIDRINKTRACHIITLEDPIEYLHKDKLSIVSQREISVDTKDCISALKACLRQSPDVIQVGEMRDSETIKAAVSAAETGHLLIATLHTSTTVNSIDRIIDSFPSENQQQIRIQLSSVLHTVVSQKLIPSTDGKTVVAFEVMHATDAIKSLIRDSKTHQIDNVIATGAANGMISMDNSILGLYRSGKISRQVALDYSNDRQYMKRRLDQ